MSQRSRRWIIEDGINLVPMLDMIFNLIFFFVVATHFGQASRQIPVSLPKSSSAATGSEQKQTVVVSISKDNKYFLDGSEMTLNDLSQKVKTGFDAGKIAAVSIQGDANSTYQSLVTLIDEFRKKNLTQFRLDALPK